ncbi:hypothetical protein K466DRAFT_603396 [Polyporus arcularius HHB13444]|uniref:Uncharacterized protein n=1 Tax=Polyporus arcularius HHB13444 TaxID=1314778 RepID=A0A5C3P0H1_9APHY|nr:hypothetical protein K466DRAFT_603396 [Polyporus arcularius HHB13444]
MDPFNPLLPALLGVAFLTLAYVFSRATTSAVDDHSHAPENSDFSVSAVVQSQSATVLEFTPPARNYGHQYTASIRRVFDNLQLESGSFLRPDVLQVEEEIVQNILLEPATSEAVQSTAGPSSAPGCSSELGGPSPPGRTSTTARFSGPCIYYTTGYASSSLFGPAVKRSFFRTSADGKYDPFSLIVSWTPVEGRDPVWSRRYKLRLFSRQSRVCSKNANHLNVLPNGERPKTAYFKSLGDERLARPPHAKLSTMGLKVGDIHMHVSPSGKQLWIYDMHGGADPSWEVVERGYKRPLDGRNLTLTTNGNPSFVGDNWAHRSNDTNRKDTRSKGKGRVDTEDDGSSDEDAVEISFESEDD